MKLATWNVNSIRSRISRLTPWLAEHQPDVMCLQELKGVEDVFPFDAVQAAGYHAVVYGQKTYNGVAILSRTEPEDVQRGFGNTSDLQARLIAAMIEGVRVVSVYVPNGRMVGTEQWAYKLAWLDHLRQWLDKTASPSDKLVVCGDTNIAIDDKDVNRVDEWAGSVLCHEEGRQALAAVMDWPVVDVVRQHHPEGGVYTWWDYRDLAFARKNGLRIDHILATEPLAKVCSSADVDRNERKKPKPSDHAPVVATFDL
ncbi:MAG: exodeoxyribonuclease III [Planctomycetota bacterium]|jgi:exodeoxyribonuclease-3